ncbi:MAG: L,D-transpeptidase [Pyrinomonadaceae bacterium]|nr:L,D-transpeptidase [Pyrinomonadaceae bacterium]
MKRRLQLLLTVMLAMFVCSSQTVVSAQPAARPRIVATNNGDDGGTLYQRLNRNFESTRSDKFTGGRIERAEFEAGQPDIRISVDVPAFRLTLWQNDREVKTYRIGVGMKDFPIIIGKREATEVIWNPTWIPPESEWVAGHKGVRPGQVIKASDPRNPLGKLKIPLGYSYLIHQAAAPTDLGNLVSHGCIRMLRGDLYDLAEKIVAARSAPVTATEIARAKQTKRTLVAKLDEPLVVDISYDTQVIEGGVLYLYHDFYDRQTNIPLRVRDELKSSGVDMSRVDDQLIEALLARVKRRDQMFVVSVESIEAGRALEAGRIMPVLGGGKQTKRRGQKTRSGN